MKYTRNCHPSVGWGPWIPACAGMTMLLMFCSPLLAKINVVTTLPVLKSITEEIGGEWVLVESLAEPTQDAHFVQPKPTLMKKASKADAFIEVGFSLELWAQKVIDSSGNVKIQMGQPGRIIASIGIAAQQIPMVLSREFGDVHPNGNPHVWLDPLNVKKMADNIAKGLMKVDPAHKVAYQNNLDNYQGRLDEALYGAKLIKTVGAKKLNRLAEEGVLISYLTGKKLVPQLGGWFKKAEPLAGKQVITYHRSWIYFSNRFGFSVPMEIEDKPGISPSPRHRDEVVSLMKDAHIHVILKELFYDNVPAEYIAKETGASIVQVPIDVGAIAGVNTYFKLIDYILDQLLATGKFKSISL